MLIPVAVDEYQVVGAVGEPGQDVQPPAGDDPGARRRVPGLLEDPPGHPLVLRLQIDRGEHAVGTHPAEEPEAADAGTGADLHHRAGGAGGGQQAQRGPGDRRDRREAHLFGQRSGHLHGPVLREVRLGVLDGLHG